MWTFADALEQCLDYIGSGAPNPGQNSQRDCKRAILSAYREIANAHRWTYFYKHDRINTVASSDTGTVAYDHTGGSSERMVTLSSGTWPSWAASGVLQIDNINYKVQSRVSDSIITLDSTHNPGADVAASTEYVIFQDTYVLPTDFVAGDTMHDEDNWGGLTYVHPRDWLAYTRLSPNSTGNSWLFTFVGSEEGTEQGRLAGKLFPYPDEARTIDFLYHRRPRALSVWEYKTGTVAVTSGAATLTGTDTVWTSSMAGSVVRLTSSTTEYPTSLVGSNPYAQEVRVLSFTSATSLTLDTNAASTLSGVRYTLSDPLDIEEGAMLTAFLRCCEKELAPLRDKRDPEKAAGLYYQALREAKAADSRSTEPKRAGGWPWGRSLKHHPKGADLLA